MDFLQEMARIAVLVCLIEERMHMGMVLLGWQRHLLVAQLVARVGTKTQGFFHGYRLLVLAVPFERLRSQVWYPQVPLGIPWPLDP